MKRSNTFIIAALVVLAATPEAHGMFRRMRTAASRFANRFNNAFASYRKKVAPLLATGTVVATQNDEKNNTKEFDELWKKNQAKQPQQLEENKNTKLVAAGVLTGLATGCACGIAGRMGFWWPINWSLESSGRYLINRAIIADKDVKPEAREFVTEGSRIASWLGWAVCGYTPIPNISGNNNASNRAPGSPRY